jgi:hypothetical protein
MARKKKTTQKKARMVKIPQVEVMEQPVSPVASEMASPLSLFSTKRTSILIGLIVVILITVILAQKGFIVAAIVNGKPIFRWELESVLMSRFGDQTLEGLVSERLISDAAAKENVEVSPKDIQAKEEEIVKKLGEGATIDDLLKFQGMTRSEFEGQIRLQMNVERILGKDIKITEGDVDNFIATNSALLVATDEAEIRKEARDTIFSQKVSERVQTWFAELKKNAKIVKFL